MADLERLYSLIEQNVSSLGLYLIIRNGVDTAVIKFIPIIEPILKKQEYELMKFGSDGRKK